MDYRKYLGKKEELVLPYLGGSRIFAPGRALRLKQDAAELPAGWYAFEVSGREVLGNAPAEPQPSLIEKLPVVRGHLLGKRLVTDGARVEDVYLFGAEEPELFAPAACRRWHSGELLFDRTELETEAEGAVRSAFLEDRTLAGVKGVPATLRAAFAYAVAERLAKELRIPISPAEIRARVADVAERGEVAVNEALTRLEAERRARAAVLEERMRDAAVLERLAVQRAQSRVAREADERRRQARRRGAAPEEIARLRVEEALDNAGARMLTYRRLDAAQVEVGWRFEGERFISVINPETLQVIDSGICLAGEDSLVTIDSLPGVVREAITDGVLVITRRV
jgi:hypothetical protein